MTLGRSFAVQDLTPIVRTIILDSAKREGAKKIEIRRSDDRIAWFQAPQARHIVEYPELIEEVDLATL